MQFILNQNQTRRVISVLELRRLLHDIIDRRPDVCIRFRMIGEMWAKSFAKIIKVTEKGVLLQDEGDARLVAINDLNAVRQFEIEHPFMGYQPHYHYDVSPLIASQA